MLASPFDLQSLTSLNSYAEAIKRGKSTVSLEVKTVNSLRYNDITTAVSSQAAPIKEISEKSYVPLREIDDIPFIDEDGTETIN